MYESTAVSMFGLLTLHAEQVINIRLDVAAMEAIASANIEELGGDAADQTAASTDALLVSLHSNNPTPAAHARLTMHEQTERLKLQNLTLKLSIDELQRDRLRPSISNMLVAFLSRADVSDLQVVLQPPDSPGSECRDTGGDGHPTVTIEGRASQEIDKALEHLRQAIRGSRASNTMGSEPGSLEAA